MKKEQAKPETDAFTRKTWGWRMDAVHTVQNDQGCTPASAAAGKTVPKEWKMHFYCYVWEDTERVNTRGIRKSQLTVTTNVFERTVSLTDPMHRHNLTKAFTEEFRTKVMPSYDMGKTDPTCAFEDSAAAANAQRLRMRNMFDVAVSVTKKDIAWQPTSTVQPAAASASKTAAGKTVAGKAETGVDVAALGAHFDTVTDKKAKGALVVSVIAGGPAAKAGLKPKDLVTKVAGQAIAAPEDVDAAIAKLAAGAKAALQLQRGGKPVNVNVLLAKPAAASTPTPAAAAEPAIARAAPASPAASALSANKACIAYVFKGNTTPPKEGAQARFELPRNDLPKTKEAFAGFMKFMVGKEPDQWGKGFENNQGCSESFCSAWTAKTFGTKQMAFMVCNNSFDEIEKLFPYLKGSESPLRRVEWSPG
jgi:hypothetical protein